MSNLTRLQAELTKARAALARLDRITDPVTDAQVAEYCALEEVVRHTEALVADEETREAEDTRDRGRMRVSMDLGREVQPVDAIETGTAIAAGMPRDYARLFGAPERSAWKQGEWLNCVLHGWHDPRLRMLGQMGEASGASGGLMVPQQLESRLLDRALHQSIVLARANISPMTTKQKLVAGFAATDQSSTLYGFSWSWLAESAEADVGSGLIRGILLNAHTGGIYVAASNELVSDAPGFEQELMTRMGDAAAEELDAAFIHGDGVGKPLGYLRSGALLVVPKETGQLAGTLLTENILAMTSHATSLQNSVWVASPSTLPALGTMVVNIGVETVSSTLLTRNEDGTLALAGRPLLLTHRCPIVGAQGDISLCDFSSYVVGLRQGVGVESSPHPGWTRREQTFRALVRCDGQPVVMTPYQGDDGRSYSPFITLAVRA